MMPDADFRAKVLRKAADFFGDFAKRRVPEKPDSFVSELLAAGCASLVGADVPPPLPVLDLLPAVSRNGHDGKSTRKKVQEMIPHARALIEASGWQSRMSPRDGVCTTYATFLLHPGSDLKAAFIAETTGVAGFNVSSYCRILVKQGLIVAGKRGHYQLSETP